MSVFALDSQAQHDKPWAWTCIYIYVMAWAWTSIYIGHGVGTYVSEDIQQHRKEARTYHMDGWPLRANWALQAHPETSLEPNSVQTLQQSFG